ncbi:hypothetical protein ABZ622_16280 [Streptomyces sp. NPDC007164]|uniref:hypothetical protein n=1 Tax=Streptomyces sp. NPDC007164 TaxID=3156918 RepID=UPI0033FD66EB
MTLGLPPGLWTSSHTRKRLVIGSAGSVVLLVAVVPMAVVVAALVFQAAAFAAGFRHRAPAAPAGPAGPALAGRGLPPQQRDRPGPCRDRRPPGGRPPPRHRGPPGPDRDPAHRPADGTALLALLTEGPGHTAADPKAIHEEITRGWQTLPQA